MKDLQAPAARRFGARGRGARGAPVVVVGLVVVVGGLVSLDVSNG